ncbi:MAG: dienelactone hydrolase family protein [Verrucomicrobiota bacterium]
MKTIRFLTATLILSATTLHAKMVEKTITHKIGDQTYESTLVYDDSIKTPRPGIFMIPNWMGPSEGSLEKARKVAGKDYVVIMADVYGTHVRPSNSKEASAAAGKLRGDRQLMRKQSAAALDAFIAQTDASVLDKGKIAAIGFCFGGGASLELGRTGADLDAIVTFHGDLISPTLEGEAKNTKAKVLVLHGADDPYVPQDHVEQFVSTMQDTAVDWQLIQYSGAVHSFTNPAANSSGAKYHEQTVQRSFTAMHALFQEIW